MRRSPWLGLALAIGCTPLRPLDPADDVGARDAAHPGMDARLVDAPTAPLPDAALDGPTADARGPDAHGPDAPGADSAARDASSDAASDGGGMSRGDAGRDAASFDAWTRDAASPSADLVAWYPFDGTRDVTGNGHDLMNVGVGFTGPIGSFDLGDALWTPSAPDLAEIVGITMWVRPSASGGGPTRATLIDRDGHFEVFQRLSGPRCTWGGGAATASGSRALDVGMWTHVACVFEAGRLSLYVAGSVDTSVPVGGTTPPSMGNLQVGQACCTGSDAFRGDLSDVRLWRRAPSAMEIAALAGDSP